MNQRLLFCALLASLTACQHEGDIQPNAPSPADEVAGTYRTNFYLDPSCVAIQAGQMPYVELKAESDSTLVLVHNGLFPNKTANRIEHVTLNRLANGVELRVADNSIGTLQTDRIFTDNGMEKQGKLLRLTTQKNQQNLVYFTGVRQ